MNEVPLFHVWTYNDVDRAFWARHLEDWVPPKMIDAHMHICDPALRVEPMTETMRKSFWVHEVNEAHDAPTVDKCHALVYPDRQVNVIAFAYPSCEWDLDGANDYLAREMPPRGSHWLAVVTPHCSPEKVLDLLRQPGCIGIKVYYSLISHNRETRDEHIEASVFEFLTHEHLEVVNAHKQIVMLHVPKADRLGHPDNIREVQEIRRRYPDLTLILAHLGRSYTEPHALEGLVPLAGDPGLYFDNSAVLNPATHRIALQHIGWRNILWGTDNPVFYMRGRRQWKGRTYINRVSYPFHFNQERESPEVEATYTLYIYEALKALKDVCREMDLGPTEVQAMMHDNVRSLIDKSEMNKPK